MDQIDAPTRGDCDSFAAIATFLTQIVKSLALLTIGACENPMPGFNVLASGCELYGGKNVSNSIPVRKSGLCKNHAQLHHDPMLLLFHGVRMFLAALHGGKRLRDG